MPKNPAILADMPIQYLENLLTLNPNVQQFPADMFQVDARGSGVTILNPDQVKGLNTTSTLPGGTQIQGGAYPLTLPVITRAQVVAAYQSKCDRDNARQPLGPFGVPDPSTTSLSGKISNVNAPSLANGFPSVQTPTNAVATTQASNPGLALPCALMTDSIVDEGVLSLQQVPPAEVQHIYITSDVKLFA